MSETRARRAGSLWKRAAGALVCAWLLAAPAAAAEPPAYPNARPAPEFSAEPLRITLDGSLQESWASMGDWGDGIAELENRSRGDGLAISGSNNPAYTTSFEGQLLFPIVGRWMGGLQYDRLSGKSEFTVTEAIGFGGSPNGFKTAAAATSNVWLLVGRWQAPTREGALHPYVQLGLGLGSARMEFTTPSGGVEGKGRGLAECTEIGTYVGDGVARLRVAAGYRFHRVKLGYSRAHGTSQPGLERFYFDFDDETLAFAGGRDVDLGGLFGRIGVSVALSR